MIFAGPRPELARISPAVPPAEKPVLSTKSGCTERRLCARVARASYTDTTRDPTAMTTAQAAMTVFAFTQNLPAQGGTGCRRGHAIPHMTHPPDDSMPDR